MSESLPYDKIEFDKKIKMKDILKTPHQSDIGCFIEIDINFPENIKNRVFSILSWK